MSNLSELDTRILELESHPPRSIGAKEEAIRARVGLSPIRYYQRLNQLIDVPAAQAAYPILVNRLRRVRDSRAQERAQAREAFRRP